MAFEHRSFRDLDPDYPFFDLDPGRDLAPATPLLVLRGLRWPGPFFHAARFDARFDIRAALQTFQPGDLLALLGDGLLQGRDLAKKFDRQRFKLWTT